MLLPILEIITEPQGYQVKHLKFSYPLNDRTLADAFSTVYKKLDPEAPVFNDTIVNIIKEGFELAKMSCNTHIEVKGEGDQYKVVGFVDVAYHQASSEAIRNTGAEIKSILSYAFSERGQFKLSHANLNQDKRSLLSNGLSWFRHQFWDLKETRSTLWSDNVVVYTLPNPKGIHGLMNIHNGVGGDDPIFIILKKYPRSLLVRELAKTYCKWYLQQNFPTVVHSDSYPYADLYSKLPHAQVCNKQLVKSIRHYGIDARGEVYVDRYQINDFHYQQDGTRVFGWYLKGHWLSVRYLHEGEFRVDQIYLPDHYTEIFQDYEFKLNEFIESVALNKISKRELRTWLSENKGEMAGVDVPYFRCIYSYLENMIDYVRLGERPIFCHDQRILRWLIHFEFITSDLKILPRGFKYCDDHYHTHTGFY